MSLERELAADRAKLKERWEPEQMLVFWLPILQADRSRADLGAKAMTDAERKVISKHYQDKFGSRPEWKDVNFMSPRPGDRAEIQYVEYGELGCGPNWFFYSDNAFRALLRASRRKSSLASSSSPSFDPCLCS